MKTITLTQPWATLVAIGAKRIETRSWHVSYRGPLAIHAAKGFPKWARETCRDYPFVDALVGWAVEVLPLGKVIATCRLIDCIPTGRVESSPYRHLFTKQEQLFGDYGEGRFAWILDNVQELPVFIPAKGMLGLWECEVQP
jgi:hypothetical protein